MSFTRRRLLGVTAATLARQRRCAPAPRAGRPRSAEARSPFRAWIRRSSTRCSAPRIRVQIPISFTHSRLIRHRAGPGVPPTTFPLEGDLAESWSQPDETTYVFKLRRGVRWHPKPPVNGRELTGGGRAVHGRAVPEHQGQPERLHAESGGPRGGGGPLTR